MTNVTAAKFAPIVSRNAVDEATHDALRMFVGRGRAYSTKELQRASGVPKRMIECAVAPVDSVEFRPLAREHFWSLALALGAPFLNHVTTVLANVGTFNLPNDELPAPGAVAADSAQDNAEIAEAARDGRFCANDHRKLWVVGQDMIERGMAFIGLGKQRRKVAA